jgi:transcriptional regulator
MKSQDEKQRFLELKAKGWSYDRIAKELKIINRA